MAASPDPVSLPALLAGRVEDVAPRLLGGVLRHGPVAVRLTEVEAYAGPDDPGSHAGRGRTPRSAVMFGPPGHLYCYLSHGIHTCANVVCGPEDTAAAVLLRAGEVVDGVEVARSRRPGSSDSDLARGPGRLCRALGIDLTLDGTRLGEGPVLLTLARETAPYGAGPRVGLRLAPDRPWRFHTLDEPSVSAYRRHPNAAPRGVAGPDLSSGAGVS